MKKIIYYVASSLDGYIAGKDDDISQFILQGKGVEKYHKDLQVFQTVIMGRKTYEFGYQYGLQPGQPAYPNMEHYIFSNNMKLENCSEQVHILPLSMNKINEIKQTSSTDIYLCGGGEFASWLLENDLIDMLIIKLNPVILGEGTRLFGSSKINKSWTLTEKESFDDGMLILTYIK